MSEIDTFKETVEKFIAETAMTPTKFGIQFAKDPRFVFQMREGREPRTQTRRRILDALVDRARGAA
jgi:predicted transcriptional regulator